MFFLFLILTDITNIFGFRNQGLGDNPVKQCITLTNVVLKDWTCVKNEDNHLKEDYITSFGMELKLNDDGKALLDKNEKVKINRMRKRVNGKRVDLTPYKFYVKPTYLSLWNSLRKHYRNNQHCSIIEDD